MGKVERVGVVDFRRIGQFIDGQAFLNGEEILYLMMKQQLELIVDDFSLSIHEAVSLVQSTVSAKYCEIYSELKRLGFCVFRKQINKSFFVHYGENFKRKSIPDFEVHVCEHSTFDIPVAIDKNIKTILAIYDKEQIIWQELSFETIDLRHHSP